MIAFPDHRSFDADRGRGIVARWSGSGDGGVVGAPVRNQLLCSLPPDARAILGPHLIVETLAVHDVLFARSAPVTHVYFPETAVVSLRSDGADEFGSVGYEGMAGLELFLNGAARNVPAFREAVVAMPGAVQRMEAAAFTALAEPSGALHRVLLRYTEGLLTQMGRAAGCNVRHRLAPRCAGWLLAACDRVAAAAFPVPLEFVAATLGVRRAGVVVVLRAFEDAGVIEARGPEIRILDPERLAAAACGCYGAVRARYARLLPPMA